MSKVILSICIPLHNRSEYLADRLQELLRVDSDEFDIIISDTSAEGRRLKDVAAFQDGRLKIYPAPETIPAMENWYLALEHADGIFALHVNDRDIIQCENLPAFIAFLKEHPQYNGGVCKSIDDAAPIVCDSVEEAIMCVPYFSLHPTGLLFNVERYKAIADRKGLFTEKFGAHPHDIVLGRLSERGKVFIYTPSIWRMAESDFLFKNKSGFEKGMKSFFFEPEQRLEELTVMLSELQKLDIDPALKAKKKDQVIADYLLLATFDYLHYIESDYQTSHYGIPQKHLSRREKIAEINKTVLLFGRALGFSCRDDVRYGFQIYKRWLLNKVDRMEKRIPGKAFQAARVERVLKKKIRSGTVLSLY